jgi:ABC-type multidrug transport system fused ATPase/permease subunit
MQAAFIYGGATVRDNILFGLPYDEERYNHSIEVACLVDDLLQMPGASSGLQAHLLDLTPGLLSAYSLQWGC